MSFGTVNDENGNPLRQEMVEQNSLMTFRNFIL